MALATTNNATPGQNNLAAEAQRFDSTGASTLSNVQQMITNQQNFAMKMTQMEIDSSMFDRANKFLTDMAKQLRQGG